MPNPSAAAFLGDVVPSAEAYLADASPSTSQSATPDAPLSAKLQTFASQLIPPEFQAARPFAQGFLGQQPGQDASYIEKGANYIGQNALPIAASVLAQPATLAASAATGPAAPLTEAALTGAAAGAGRLVQTGIQNLVNTAGGPSPYTPLIPAAKQAGIEAGLNAAGVLGGKAIAAGGKALFNYLATSKIAGGIAEPAWDYFKGNVQKVMDSIGLTPTDADTMANNLRISVSNSTQQLEDAYRAGAQQLSKDPANAINLSTLSNQAKTQIGEDFGYYDPLRNADLPEAKFFDQKIVQKLDKLGDATPYQVYEFQKDLNGYIRDQRGSTLGAALSKVRDATKALINQTDSLKPIQEINNSWASAKIIDQEASKMTNANDLIGYVQRVFNNPRDTLQKQALESVASKVPEVAQGLGDVRSYLAAQQLTPMVRGFPATGYGAAAAYGLYKAGSALASANPLAAAAAVPALMATSPRLYGLAYQAATKLPTLAPGASNVLSGQIANYTIPWMTPQSINKQINTLNNPYKQ